MLSSKRLFTAALFASMLAGSALHATSALVPEDEARLKATGSCPGCNLSGADLNGLVAELGDLTNADFTEANLYRAVLKGANLTGANFNGANLSGALLQHAKGVDLTGAITDHRTLCPNGEAGPCS